MEDIVGDTAREKPILLIDKVLADYHAEIDNKCSRSGKRNSYNFSSEVVKTT
jgi:hypothetical protein